MKFPERIWRFLVNLRPVPLAVLIFSIALLVRLAFMIIFRPYENLGRLELERVAISLATTGVYGNPYALPTGPTAHVSPGYTLLLAGLFHLFGTGISGEIVKELLTSTVTSFQCASLPLVASGLSLDRRAGILAGLVSAIYPVKPLVQIDGDWETPYTAIFLMLLSVITAQLWRKRAASTRSALLHGVSWGVALLFVSALLPMFLIFLAVGAYIWRGIPFRSYLRFAAMELLVVALFLAPWAIRNYYALGSPILTRSNFGLEMRISNNDLATPSERANDTKGLYQIYHPLQNPSEALKVRQMGEVAYNKKALEEAEQWIRTHPTRFLRLSLGRIGWFWLFIDRTSWMKTLFLDVTVFLGFAGLLYVFRADRMTGTVLALILLLYPLPNYLIHLGLRQKYPIDWLMTLLSAVVIVSWWMPRVFPRDTPAQY